MTTNSKVFNDRLKLIGVEIVSEPTELKRKIALQIQRAVVLATPVLTGRARANWNTSLRNADKTTTEETDKGGQRTISEGSRVILDAGPDEIIWISNHLPYIGALNDGSSKQAPKAFVQKAVIAGVESVKR